MNWTDVPRAVEQLLEVIDNQNPTVFAPFRVASITVTSDKNNRDTLVVAAFNKEGKAFKYAMYVGHSSGDIVADGF